MPNFSKDKSGFNIGNPMDKTEVKGKSSELPGMIGTRSDNPSPNKFLGKIFKSRVGRGILTGGASEIHRAAKNKLGGGGGELEGRVAALEAQAGGGGGGAAGAMGAAQAAVAPEEQVV